MFLLHHSINLYWQSLIIPICLVTAWTIVGLLVWNIWAAIADAFTTTKRMHEIPCANCQYFTGDYHLKCTVRPFSALTEDAIQCHDYDPESLLYK